MTKRKHWIGVVVVAALFALSLLLIIGIDTDWGRVEVTKIDLATAEGDRLSALLYKPRNANKDNKVPIVLYSHGGSDMLEQGSSYAVELIRRGYAFLTFDHTGAHNSDSASGTSESGNMPRGGGPAMGYKTVWNAVKLFDFVDQDKIITMGHSMGGQYSAAFAAEMQDEVFLQINIGMNSWGSPALKYHNYNFVNILGDSDESTLARTNNNTSNIFKQEQLKRMFYEDYVTPFDQLPDIEFGKVYQVKGTDGKTYKRMGLYPNSCHAYYLVDNDAIKSVVYAVTTMTGYGVDANVKSYADLDDIKLVWAWKDFGYVLQLAATVAAMIVLANYLLDTAAFKGLVLKPTEKLGIDRKGEKGWMYWIFFVVLFAIPVILFRKGVLSSRKFLGMNISKLWLVAGNTNSYVSWQWTVSLALIVIFFAYHFLYGKKHGGNAQTYGFRTSNDGKFNPKYIANSFIFSFLCVGFGYLIFSIISAYTKQAMHIATFMISKININRTLAIVMYFLFQIPYFLTSSLALKSVGVAETDDDWKGTLKSIGLGTLLTVFSVFLLWVFFVIVVNKYNTVTTTTYFSADRIYITTIAILPMFIGMTIANSLNMVISKKTKSIWAGLFAALLWGTWMMISCGGLSKSLY